METDGKYKCSQCGSRSFAPGHISADTGFWASDVKFIAAISAVACLDCGTITHFLSPENLAKLRSKVDLPRGD